MQLPMMRSMLVQSRSESALEENDEELKYSYMSFHASLMPNYTKEASTQSPSVPSHAPLTCPGHLLQESFYQEERNDDCDKIPRSKFLHNDIHLGQRIVRAHAGTSLLSKKKLDTMKSSKRANPYVHGRDNYGYAASLQ